MSIHETFTTTPTELEKNAEVVASEVRHNLCRYEAGIKTSFDGLFPLNGCSEAEAREKGELNDIAHIKFREIIGAEDISEDKITYGDGKRLYVARSFRPERSEDGSLSYVPFFVQYSSEPVEPMIAEVPETERRPELTNDTLAPKTDPCVLESITSFLAHAREVGEQALKGFTGPLSGSNVIDIDKSISGTEPTLAD